MNTIDIVYHELERRFHTFQTPVVELIEAQTKDPFKILITTLLSARTKDQTTSAVVTRLFKQIDSYEDLKKYSLEELEKMIYPVGFFRNKAVHLKKLPEVLNREFKGIIPYSHGLFLAVATRFQRCFFEFSQTVEDLSASQRQHHSDGLLNNEYNRK